MIFEDNLDDKNINEIFQYCSSEEIFFYYKIMPQQINDQDHTTKYNMWYWSTYKSIFE